MTSKHVYLVRHGESLTNASKVRLGPEAPLTELGKKQARIVAERLRSLKAKRLIVSPYKRTKGTAEPIAETTGLSPEYSALFVERRGPSIVMNRHSEDPEVQEVWRTIIAHAHIPGWRHSDEENFEDLSLRADQALVYLEPLPEDPATEDPTIVVTHGMFMKMLLAKNLLGKKLDGRIFWDCFVPAKNVANTGIMHIEFTNRFDGSGMYWKLHSWNDHAHLSPDLL